MFYELDGRRVTLREYCRGTPRILMPLAMLAKAFRLQHSGSSDDPAVESLEPFRVERGQLPPEMLVRFKPLEEQLQACGFLDPVYYLIDDPYSQTRICQAVYRHNSGKVLGKIHYRRWSAPARPRESLFPMFLSCFADGSFWVSSAGKPDLLPPPFCETKWSAGATVPDLWKSHSQQLSLQGFGKPFCTAYSQSGLIELVERHHAAVRDFHVQRGVFKPREQSIAASVAAPARPLETSWQPIQRPSVPVGPPLAPAQSDLEPVEAALVEPEAELDPVVVATLGEVDRLQNRKASGTGGLLLLIITVGVFFAVGGNGFNWRWLSLLAGVLFVHELGHLAAMWLFRYRNLRMFFIPLFGAAVTGQNYNVPGWKKAIVSFMGPFPGIVLGIALGIAATILHRPEMLEVVLMLLLINAFNLLPIVPLDGGWLMHAVLFSRHPVIDVTFRAIAALVLISSLLLGMRVLAFVGAGMLFSLPLTYRVAQTVRRLRAAGFAAVSPDAQTVPARTAVAIVGELRSVLPAKTSVKTMAKQTLQVFESLNARPPGWLASLGFIVFHAGTLFVALVASLIFALALSPTFRQFCQLAARQPEHAVIARDVRTWHGPAAADAAPSSTNTVVANFRTRAEGEAAYEELTRRLPPRAAATLFGDTLLVALPGDDDAAREKWCDELERKHHGVFVQASEAGTPFTLICLARNGQEAQAIAEEAQQYFQIPSVWHPVPPWSKQPSLSEADRKARRTYWEIHQRLAKVHEDPRLAAFEKNLQQRTRRGDRRAAKELIQEQSQIVAQLQKEVYAKMTREGPVAWDLEVLKLTQETMGSFFEDFDEENPQPKNAEQKAKHLRDQRLLGELARRLGQLPLRDGKPTTGAGRLGTLYGSVERAGLLLRFPGLSLTHPAQGAPALADWLAAKGCVDLKYQFHSAQLPWD